MPQEILLTKHPVLQLIFSFVIFGIVSCSSYTDDTKNIRSEYANDRYKEALVKLEESVLKDQGRNKLLYLLEKAMIEDRLGEREVSRNLLIEAEKLAEKLYATSISKEALTYIYNESVQDYSGEDYEKVAIHIILSLSFLQDRKYNEALVSSRRINLELIKINNVYDNGKNHYNEDAFARYLAGCIHEAQGEKDNALISYQKAIEIYEKTYATTFNTRLPDQVVAAAYRLALQRGRGEIASELEKKFAATTAKVKANIAKYKNMGEVIAIHEYGQIATKVANEFMLPAAGQVIRISFPIIRPFERGSRDTGIQIGDGDFTEAETAQKMDYIAAKTLDDRRVRLILKQGARLIAKASMTEQAYRQFGIAGGIAANVYSAVSETADTRGWTLFPGVFYVSRTWVETGKHKVQVKTNGKIGSIHKLDIQKGEIALFREIH